MTATALTTDTVTTLRTTPIVEPANCSMQSNGAVFREWVIVLPRGTILDDLKEPSMWKRVQTTPSKSLRVLDRVILLEHDRKWVAEAIVSHADAKMAVLATPSVTKLGDRYEQLLSTEDYRVEWIGTGYAVVEKRTGRHVSQPVASAAIAERDLERMYPRG